MASQAFSVLPYTIVRIALATGRQVIAEKKKKKRKEDTTRHVSHGPYIT
jgi:hypothetical protein